MFVFFYFSVLASHLIGGNIQVTQLNEKDLIYEITVTIYSDLEMDSRVFPPLLVLVLQQNVRQQIINYIFCHISQVI